MAVTLSIGSSRLHTCSSGNILVCLLLFHLLPFCLLNIYLLLSAALLLNFHLPRFCMPLLKFLGVILQGTSTDIIWCSYRYQNQVFAFLGIIFFVGHDVLGVFLQGASTNIDYNLRQVGLVHIVIGWDLKSCKLVCTASVFHSTLNCTLNLSRVWLTTANRSKNVE